MAKIIVITDTQGNILGSVRSDPIEADGVMVQFQPVPDSRVEYHELDVSDSFLDGPVERLHAECGQRLRA